MSTILVSGGAGFIGSTLVRLLAAQRHPVRVLDNLSTGRAEHLEGLPVDLRVGDLRNASALASALDGVDRVYHLACLGVRHSLMSPRENHDVNASATLSLLLAAQAAGVRRFVHVSTSEVYGSARHSPMCEDHPSAPTTVYGASKLAGECYARALFATHGFPAVVVRPFNSYGPRCHHEGDSGEVIPRFMLRCEAGRPAVVFGDGLQTRDFTYVDDTAAGILAAGFAPGIEGETINLGSGAEVTILDLAERISAACGMPLRVEHDAPRPGDVRRLVADASKAARLLGFVPSVTLDDGLRRLVAWYRSRPQSAAELLRDEQLRNWVPC